MKYSVKELLDLGEAGQFAVPAFNIYNFGSLMGIKNAALETGAPVIFQVYTRLFDTETARYLMPSILEVVNDLKTPAAIHLDHGRGVPEVLRAIRYGATGVMIDASTLPFEENVAATKAVVDIAKEVGISVEGEIGHVGAASNGDECGNYTEVDMASEFVRQTGVDAIAIMVGTAHGKYKKAPVLAIDRIAEIHAATKAHLVLHGGSGVPEDQIRAAVQAGIRKVNYATDVCCAFIEGYKKLDPYSEPFDVLLSHPADDVKEYAISRIRLLGADRYGK